jgi:hypothetical protein
MKRFFCIIATSLIFFYLLASKMDWFTELARSSVARNPVFSEPINLTERKTFFWEVPTKRIITRNGQAHLYLVLNTLLLTEIPYDRSQVELKAKVSAHGRRLGGKRQNRLIINERFNTDEPFKKDGGFGESHGGGRIDYALAAIDVREGEVLTIELSITTPDPKLASGNPRLKLVGEHDFAGTPYEFLFQYVLVNWGFYLSLILLFGLFLVAWGRKNQRMQTDQVREKKEAGMNPNPKDEAFFERKDH